MPVYACPRCIGGVVLPETDEHHQRSLTCVNCGWVGADVAAAREHYKADKKHARGGSHRKLRLK